jgi:pyruvate dehydrogenase E2 component (dihydrolipoamide acetyltransferase)
MPIEILMPALSPTMTEGNLAKWNVKEGDKIKSGQVIAEIETDKATMEVEAVDAGTIGKIMIPAGTENVKVNALIAVLLEDGETAADAEKFAASKASAAPTATPAKAAAEAPVATPAPAAPTTNHQPPTTSGGRTFASPLAKRIAADAGVPIAQVQGTGPHGRVVKSDVESFIASGGAAKGVVRRNAVETTAIPNNNMRKVIAKRLTESKQTVPHFYLNLDIELDRLLDVRKQLNDAADLAAKKQGKDAKPAYKLSVNDFVIKATAMAMKDVPAANASWTDAAILQYNNVDISVAVAIDGGLITPIVKNADQKTITTISGEMKDLAARAKAGRLQPEEFQGGGLSISNLGMYGISSFAAIVNPPQGCILAVGAGAEKVLVKSGKMEIANVMTVTLSVDHRVVDGAVGAEFLAAFKRYCEAPALLLV